MLATNWSSSLCVCLSICVSGIPSFLMMIIRVNINTFDLQLQEWDGCLQLLRPKNFDLDNYKLPKQLMWWIQFAYDLKLEEMAWNWIRWLIRSLNWSAINIVCVENREREQAKEHGKKELNPYEENNCLLNIKNMHFALCILIPIIEYWHNTINTYIIKPFCFDDSPKTHLYRFLGITENQLDLLQIIRTITVYFVSNRDKTDIEIAIIHPC